MLTKARNRISEYLFNRQLPMVVTVADFDSAGVRFEVSNITEHFRTVLHGGETDYTQAMLSELRPADVLWDIGANVGMVALHAARVCETVAFEPDPSFQKRLAVNTALNPGREFPVEPVAISDTDGKVTLYTDGDSGNSPSLAKQMVSGSTEVTARSLDSLIAEGRLPHPTVLKLDIEGAEILALRGGKELLASPQRPRSLFIEIHDTYLPAFNSSSQEVHTLLAQYGYTRETYKSKRNNQTHLILHAC